MPSDLETTPPRRSVARFFVENRHVSWVLLVGVIAWGIWAYAAMPKRKDPDIPVRQVAVVTPWPGQSAERVEQLVTRKVEERVAQVGDVRHFATPVMFWGVDAPRASGHPAQVQESCPPTVGAAATGAGRSS